MNTLSLKALREKRNANLSLAKELISKVESEERSLTDEETALLTEYRSAITDADSTMKQITETRDLDTSIENETENTEKSEEMPKETQEELETRAMNAYLKTGSVEVRDENGDLKDSIVEEDTDGNGGVLAPTTVYKQIIAKLDEEAPVFQAVRRFTSQLGSLKLPREKSVASAGFVGEGANVKNITSQFGTVKLDQKRVGASMQLTTELQHDSAVDLLAYSTSRLTRAIGKAVERAILLGADEGQSADDTFRPVIGAKDVQTQDFDGTVEGLIDMHNALNPAYLNGAMWVVSRDVFNTISKLKDGDGRYLLINSMIGDVPGYTLLGSRIFVSDALKGAKQDLIFGNFNEGYGLMIKQGVTLQHVTNDTQQALSGGHLVVMSAMMDGEVINPDAFVTAKGKAPKA